VSDMDIARVGELGGRVLDEVGRAVVGKREVLELLLLGLLCEGHVLVEDYPGLAKTLMASSLAAATGLDFKRIQFTPDLMPSDVTGSSLYDQRSGDFHFHPGPVFTNLLLADEINRAPAKTQAALLEAMQERQVTTEGRSDALPRPFTVVATQNPIEFEGTYPLPEAQLDRFLLRVAVGYPTRQEEADIVRRRAQRRGDDVALHAVVDAPTVLDMQAAVERVHLDDSIAEYIVAVVAATRENPGVGVGASPRGSLALLKLSRARAALQARDFVTPDDVKAVAVPALAHRLMLRPELWVQRVRTEDVVAECLRGVPTPVRVDDAAPRP
jgi:MoxR-like ATPase